MKKESKAFAIFFILLAVVFLFHQNGIDLLNLNAESLIVENKEFNLKSFDGNNVSIQEFPIHAKSHNRINLSFKVKSANKIEGPIPLLIDIYGTNYDLVKYDVLLQPEQITRDFSKHEFHFLLGTSVPVDTRIRVYTLSTSEIQVSNFNIQIVRSNNPIELFIFLSGVFLIFYTAVKLFLLLRSQVKISESSKLILCYWFLAGVTFLYCLWNSEFQFYHDSNGYWNFSKLFLKDGCFSILNYNNALRGYFFPLINFLILSISDFIKIDGYTTYRFFSSMAFPFFVFIFLPNFIETLFNIKIVIQKRFLFYFLFLFFWRGYILYPLTDFFAFFSVAGSFFLLLSDKIKNNVGWRYLFGSGFYAASAVNMRPSYILILIPIIALVAWLSVYEEGFKAFHIQSVKKISKNLFIWLFGLVIVFAPQMKINQIYFNSSSPFVQMEKFFSGKNLMLAKLYLGLTTQKYETYIGSEHNAVTALLLDPAGFELIKNENLKEFVSYGSYFKTIFRNPLKIFGIYMRHLFNGLDIMFSTPYVSKFNSNEKYLYQFANYTLWFFFFVLFWRGRESILKNIKGLVLIVVSTILLPTIVSIPTEPEVRFFMPVFLFMYAAVTFFQGWSNVLEKNKRTLLFLYLIFLASMFLYSRYLFQNLHFS